MGLIVLEGAGVPIKGTKSPPGCWWGHLVAMWKKTTAEKKSYLYLLVYCKEGGEIPYTILFSSDAANDQPKI